MLPIFMDCRSVAQSYLWEFVRISDIKKKMEMEKHTLLEMCDEE